MSPRAHVLTIRHGFSRFRFLLRERGQVASQASTRHPGGQEVPVRSLSLRLHAQELSESPRTLRVRSAAEVPLSILRLSQQEDVTHLSPRQRSSRGRAGLLHRRAQECTAISRLMAQL